MKDSRFTFGSIVTAIWLCVMVGITIFGTRPEKLNEWGDFFAGFFAPLAFLWLVIGYLQQGEELRQSSEALRLQAEELKNSVEQQSHLVDVSRQQLEQETLAIHEERQLRIAALRPKFLFGQNGYHRTNNQIKASIELQNVGGTSINTVVVLEQAEGKLTLMNHEVLNRGAKKGFNALLAIDGTYLGEIEWEDEYGNRDKDVFSIGMEGETIIFAQPRVPKPSKMSFSDKAK